MPADISKGKKEDGKNCITLKTKTLFDNNTTLGRSLLNKLHHIKVLCSKVFFY
jgi:hypothetical protein